MKKFFRKYSRDILIVIILIMSITLITCAFTLLADYSNGLEKQSETAALLYAEKPAHMLETVVGDCCNDVLSITDKLPGKSTEEVCEELKLYEKNGNGRIHMFRYMNDGVEYDSNGQEYTYNESADLQMEIAKGKLSCCGYVYDRLSNSSFIAVYSPVQDNENIDGLIAFYLLDTFTVALNEATDNTMLTPDYFGLCKGDGEIIRELNTNGFMLSENDNLFEVMRGQTNDKATVDEIRTMTNTIGSSVKTIDINSSPYVTVIETVEYTGARLFLMEIVDARVLNAEGYLLVNTVTGILLIMAIIMSALFIYVIIIRFKSMDTLESYFYSDPLLGCPTFNKFSLVTKEILKANSATKFAIVYYEIQRFSYISEHFGESISDDILRYLVTVFTKSIMVDEKFGHIGDDKFVLLMYNRTDEELRNKLNVMLKIIANCPATKSKGYEIRSSVGVYRILGRSDELTVQKMLDRAIIAQKSMITGSDSNITFFSESLHNTYLHEAEIEAGMENAITNNEFKVFYQPKYNIANDRIDGCEALVRWYDPVHNIFHSPAEFMPLMEANGFINKLDRYVFLKVCEFIDESVTRGYRQVPISINASRVTAIQPGFVEYYVETKKNFGIRDNFITIEFTESFSYEDYDALNSIIVKLKSNGFRCSIDDFGSGFSSYNVLKDLPMDELKLDRFFIAPGISHERDDMVLGSVISLAKQIGMVVTQEGVETSDDMERVTKLGCDVVQGYYYSKPLASTDYIAFIAKSGSLKDR